MSKDTVGIGDKITISVQAGTAAGNFPYQQGQLFNAYMDADAQYGKLYWPGSPKQKGTALTSITQPFEFLAADSINVDSLAILISAYPVYNGGGSTDLVKGRGIDTVSIQKSTITAQQNISNSVKRVSTNIDLAKHALSPLQAKLQSRMNSLQIKNMAEMKTDSFAIQKTKEQETIIAQKIASKKLQLSAINDAVQAQAAGKSDTASIKHLKHLMQSYDEGSCPSGATLTEVKESIPRNIFLQPNPLNLSSNQSSKLKVTLTDGQNDPIDEDHTSALINYSAGEGTGQWGVLNYQSQQGSTLTGIPYKAAHDNNVTLKNNYDGRFPLRIGINATCGNLSPDRQILTLTGSSTTGKYFKMGSYKDSDYDTEEDEDGNPLHVKIIKDGCALCCIAMALTGYGINVDPVSLNNWMSSGDHYCFDIDHNGRIIFNTFTDNYVVDHPIGLSLEQDNKNLSPINYNLNQGNPSMVAIPSGDHLHWLLVTGIDTNGNYTVLDPGEPQGTPLKTILHPTDIVKYREIITN
ncbi:MAG TPA: C39 family peptidase [Bacteroidota bacterium]|nr:C39 family peptidase [Bacteroidota bacterium]